MKKEIITTLIKEKLILKKNKFFVNLPNNICKKEDNNFFYYNKHWKSSSKLLKDFDYLENIFEKNLRIISKKLNTYHRKKYPISYWRLIIGKWMFRFICLVYERYDSIIDIDKNYKNLKFKKLRYNLNNFIPYGIEDYNYIAGTHGWNEYIYSEIINQCKIKSIEVVPSKRLLGVSDSKEIYKRLSTQRQTIKGKIYSIIIKLLSNFNKDIKYLVFDTYLNFIDVLKLNFKINNKLFLFTSLKFDATLLDRLKKKKLSKIRKFSSQIKINNFKNFISEFILINLPKAYLEGYDIIENSLKTKNLPLSPKVIFTSKGINRSTLMDRYIASKLLLNTKLIVAQHGGNYGQHKGHWGSKHEMKISNKFLSWESKKTKFKIPFGLIKNIKKINYNKKNKLILLEIRNRILYSNEIKIDHGGINSVIYLNKINKLLSRIKSRDLLKNFMIKNREANFGWEEKKIFLESNKNIQFINPKLKMTDLLKKSKLIIYSFPSTGHLECMSANIPMLLFYFNDLELLKKETKLYFKEFIKLGILHTDPDKLYKKLIEIYDDPSEWWYSKKIQKSVNNYAKRFCKRNDNLIKNLSNIIMDK